MKVTGPYRRENAPPFETEPHLRSVDEVLAIDYNRNGSGSARSHWCVTFIWKGDDGDKMHRMVGIVFNCDCLRVDDREFELDEVDHKCEAHISVQYLDQLAINNAKWNLRGDWFFDDLCKVISDYNRAGWPDWDPADKNKEETQGLYTSTVEVLPEKKAALT